MLSLNQRLWYYVLLTWRLLIVVVKIQTRFYSNVNADKYVMGKILFGCACEYSILKNKDNSYIYCNFVQSTAHWGCFMSTSTEVNTQILLLIYPEWPSQYRNDPSGYKVQYFPLFASHFYSARCQVWPHTLAFFQLFAGPVRPPNNVTSVCDGGIIIITTKKDMSCITHVALNAPSAWDSTNVTQVLLHRTLEFPRKTLVCTGWWMLFYLSVVLSL